MKIVDDKCKKVNWWNRNYMFVATILIVAANVLLFAFVKENFAETKCNATFGDFSFDGILYNFLSSFVHTSWEQVIFNMVCFFLCGLYLERKTGSFSFILLIAAISLLGKGIIALNTLVIGSTGFGVVNCLLYAYIIIEYLFAFQKGKRNLLNIIYGAILIVLMYVSLSITSISPFKFDYYPKELISNITLYTSFIAGIIISLTVQIARLNSKKELK